MAEAWDGSPWDAFVWGGIGTLGYITPDEIICLSADVIFTVELDGAVLSCNDEN